MMILGAKKTLWPVFLFGVLAIFLFVPTVQAQGTKDLPPPPPLWKPKPTPTPKPVEPTVIDSADVIKTDSNLVMVPVSVTDQTGQAVQGLKVEDFRLQEEDPKAIESDSVTTRVVLVLLHDRNHHHAASINARTSCFSGSNSASMVPKAPRMVRSSSALKWRP